MNKKLISVNRAAGKYQEALHLRNLNDNMKRTQLRTTRLGRTLDLTREMNATHAQ